MARTRSAITRPSLAQNIVDYLKGKELKKNDKAFHQEESRFQLLEIYQLWE